MVVCCGWFSLRSLLGGVVFRVRRGFFGLPLCLQVWVGSRRHKRFVSLSPVCVGHGDEDWRPSLPPSFPPRLSPCRPFLYPLFLSLPSPTSDSQNPFPILRPKRTVRVLSQNQKKKPKKLKKPQTTQPTRRRRTIPIASSRLLAVVVSLLLFLRSFVSPPTCSPPGLICCVELREKERQKK